jgi:putative endonuclease
MYTVYIIKNYDGQLYKGYTANIERRLSEHNSGKSRWSKFRGPWKLVYYEEYQNKSDAIKRELFFKSGKGRELLKKILK